jgi:hypothetical protein
LLKNGAELWFSIVHAPTTSSNASLVFALGDEAVADPHRIENNGNGIGFRIQNGSDLNAVTFKNGEFVRNVAKKRLAEDEPHLIVGKIEWGSTNGDEDTLTLFLPDRRLKLRSALPKPIGATLDQSSFDTISLFGRNYGMVDEIRFGGSFDDIVSGLAGSKPASAAAEPAPVDAKATLGQVASAKRSAVFQLSTRTDHSFGVFISRYNLPDK